MSTPPQLHTGPAWSATEGLGTQFLENKDHSVYVLPGAMCGAPPGYDDGAAITAAFSLLPSIKAKFVGQQTTYQLGTVRLGPYAYNIASQITKPSAANLIGAGPGTLLNVGPGGIAAIYSHGTGLGGIQPGNPATMTAGVIEGMRIDGTNAGANATGIDIGDAWGHIIRDVSIVNFEGSGAVGLHINNAVDYTEKSHMQCELIHCTTAVLVDIPVNSTNTSMEYNEFDFNIMADTGQAGMVLRRGAFISGGYLRIGGNFPANSGPVLTLSGDNGSGQSSTIFHNRVEITVESNAGSNQPQTINFGESTNAINNCWGALTFQFTTWAASNVAAGQLAFWGVISGDANLVAANSAPQGTPAWAAPVNYSPNDPASTASTSLVMMGLAKFYTPQSSGQTLVVVTGTAYTDTAAATITVACRHSTGLAPSHGAAVTGTAFGGNYDPTFLGAAASGPVAFAFTDVLNLTAGTAYWFDLALATANGSDGAHLHNISISLAELR